MRGALAGPPGRRAQPAWQDFSFPSGRFGRIVAGEHSPSTCVKLAFHLIIAAILLVGWGYFLNDRATMNRFKTEANSAALVADFETAEVRNAAAEALEGKGMLTGILLSLLSAGYIGVLCAVYILPAVADKMTHAVYDSGEMVEPSAMRDARALVAQGDYAGAIEAFRRAAHAEPGNRMPWVEMARLQAEQLGEPEAAVATLREALESQSWGEDDGGYLFFRLADGYFGLGDVDGAAEILTQLIETYPETRHSANARHRLAEWGRGAVA